MLVPFHVPKTLGKSSCSQITIHQKVFLPRFIQTGIGKGVTRALLVQDEVVVVL